MTKPPVEWCALLIEAVDKPGVISDAYHRFWNYSIGNQLLTLFQCRLRGIEPGPLHTFVGWHSLGRHIRKGEKALTLCMPVTVKKKSKEHKPTRELVKEEDKMLTRFVYRPNWFVLGQTDGAEYVPTDLPQWTEVQALSALSIDRVSFTHLDGNVQGYASKREVAVSPISFAPHRTLFHELAHVVLGHTTEVELLDDHEKTPRNLREVEAECVALICSESLGLSGSTFSRGYIQHWLGSKNTIPERSAQKIFKAADEILKAGLPETLRGESNA